MTGFAQAVWISKQLARADTASSVKGCCRWGEYLCDATSNRSTPQGRLPGRHTIFHSGSAGASAEYSRDYGKTLRGSLRLSRGSRLDWLWDSHESPRLCPADAFRMFKHDWQGGTQLHGLSGKWFYKFFERYSTCFYISENRLTP